LRWFSFSPCFIFFLTNIQIMWIFSTTFFEHPCSIHIVFISPWKNYGDCFPWLF
jgi:hypothetical protein